MLIAEIFESIQGEGPWTGEESLFLRTSGCNLRCWFCDTPYTSWQPEGTQWTLDDLVGVVAASSRAHLVITGGEPMLSPELPELTRRCRRLGRLITIETAGTVFQDIACDLVAISPKLSNSVPVDAVWASRHERTRKRPDVIRRLLAEYNSILKFVIDTPQDLAEVHDYLESFPQVRPQQIWLMPQARTPEQLVEQTAWLRPVTEKLGFCFSPRLHLELFGGERGT